MNWNSSISTAVGRSIDEVGGTALRCRCDGILKVVAQALHWIRYECRRCKKQYEWKELT
jgi:hypothetical protein